MKPANKKASTYHLDEPNRRPCYMNLMIHHYWIWNASPEWNCGPAYSCSGYVTGSNVDPFFTFSYLIESHGWLLGDLVDEL